MQTITQNYQLVNYLAPVDASGSSLSKSNATFIGMKGFNKVTFIVNAGAMTEATTSVAAYTAINKSGSSVASSALALGHYWTNKSSTSTAVLTRTTASSSKMVVTSANNAQYVVEYDAKQFTSSHDYICLAITGVSAGAFMQVTAVLHDARYASDPMIINVKA